MKTQCSQKRFKNFDIYIYIIEGEDFKELRDSAIGMILYTHIETAQNNYMSDR